MSSTSTLPPVGNSRWFRLIPIAMIVYIISFMDRTNIAYAFSGIGHDFHVTKAQEGNAGGIFFVGYILLQIPGGYLGPFLGGYLQDETHNFYATAILFAVSLFAAGVLMMTINIRSVPRTVRGTMATPAE